MIKRIKIPKVLQAPTQKNKQGALLHAQTSAGGCWRVVLPEKSPGGPGAEDTPQLPSDQTVFWASRAASRIFPQDGQICRRASVPNSLPCMARDTRITERLCSGCSPLLPCQLSTADILPFFPLFLVLPLFWHCHYGNILSASSSSLPGRDEEKGEETCVTPRCLNLLLCAPSLVSSCRNHFCRIPGEGELSGLHMAQLKP